MSLYNTISGCLICPVCKQINEFDVFCKLGLLNFVEYKLGDEVEWLARKSMANGGRPADGNADFEGWTECPNCDSDFFLTVVVRSDRIREMRHDPSKEPLGQSRAS